MRHRIDGEDPLADLPPPDPDARAHAEKLASRVHDEIEAAGGALPFDRFMELALYAPGLGYYSAGSHKLGAAGDFVTAPEVSPLFARVLAVQCAELLGRLGGGEILEVGAGSGVMAAELLAGLERRGALPERYRILEVSGELRERQQATLEARAPGPAERVTWLESLPEAPLDGVILGNEVIDALPAKRFMRTAEGVREVCVTTAGEGFEWCERPPDEALAAAVGHLEADLGRPLPEGYVSEVRPALPAWLASLADGLNRGAMLWIDYGMPRHEYYHPERETGTLLCHYRHRAHADPLRLVGLQDITVWVDFTALAEAGEAAGLEVLGYTTQAHLLLGGGLEQLAEASGEDARSRGALSQQVQRLTLPGEMGERFKAMLLGRGVEATSGFAMRDLRNRL